ncbi:hypothetical protein [Peribacillus simplex]
MLLIGYLFNIDSERELEQEVHLNLIVFNPPVYN